MYLHQIHGTCAVDPIIPDSDNFFFFFLTCPHKNGKIRTNDHRFMRRGLQPIELPIKDDSYKL
jgi:hypothetical protein